MSPWTIDADDIQLATEFDEGLLCHTSRVDEFLNPASNRFVVLGTKGIGKTLLLKAKRIACQDRIRCLPANALIDKPIGDKIFNSDMINLYSDSTENWKTIWLLSISLTVLKALDRVDGLDVCRRLWALVKDEHLTSVVDHFVSILEFPRNNLFRAAGDLNTRLMPRIRNVDTPLSRRSDEILETSPPMVIKLVSGKGP